MPKRRSTRSLVTAAAIAALFSASGSAQAKDARSEAGERDYQSLCASCHGPDAKGDGPVAPVLDPRPADLTEIAKRRDGVFPVPTVTRMIDGRDPVIAHGTRAMPVWGKHFDKGTDTRDGFGYSKGRIQLLVEYLKSIQQPAEEQ
jgi:mono/diheme cytochrome c family protein